MFQKQYAKHYDLLNQNKNYGKEISFVYNWAGRPESVIDIGCGTASYWQYFPDDIFIRGVEKSKAMVQSSKYKRHIKNEDIKDFFLIPDIEPMFDCAVALFDVINYMKDHSWWPRIPIYDDGCFIFDIWDKKKVLKDGFEKTTKAVNGLCRQIKPLRFDSNSVDLQITITNKKHIYSEIHTMYLYSERDIKRFCGAYFKIDEIHRTKKWQTWYKLIKK